MRNAVQWFGAQPIEYPVLLGILTGLPLGAATAWGYEAALNIIAALLAGAGVGVAVRRLLRRR
jgi:hypothetical protein